MVIAVGGLYDPIGDRNQVQMYNVKTGTWTLKNNFPFALKMALSFVLRPGRLFVLGGKAPGEAGKVIREYDFEKDFWKDGPQLPHSYFNGMALVYNL